MDYSTVMQVNEDSTFQAEYQEAVENGFKGTYEEYLQYRDYT